MGNSDSGSPNVPVKNFRNRLKMSSKGLVVGLTGGIACGKTTVVNIFRELGAEVINSDLIGHQVLKEDGSAKSEVISAFGRGILNDDGEIDRSKLGQIVFSNPDLLRKLNEIVHPPIIERINSEVGQKLSSAKSGIVILEVPLLIEANMTHMVDFVVLVYAGEETQIDRLVQRGLSRDDAKKRIDSQMPSREKARFADFIIYNNNSLPDTATQVEAVWVKLTEANGNMAG